MLMAELQIIEMDHIVLNVSDVERSLAFYIDVLGLQGERLEEFRNGDVGFPSVRINDNTLVDLMSTPGAKSNPEANKNLNHYCLVARSVDLAQVAEDLRAQGVTIAQEPVSRWGARGQAMSIYILDPDENEIEIRCY
jgi:catechol 2,3-dioxygenase-like lactoylglutathione lyase family enzyme